MNFGRTLIKGIEKFKKVVQDVKYSKLSGHDAFILWDTYGFLIDLTNIMEEEIGLEVDREVVSGRNLGGIKEKSG